MTTSCSNQTMRKKCRRKNIFETSETSFGRMCDEVGCQIACFIGDDFYWIVDSIREQNDSILSMKKRYKEFERKPVMQSEWIGGDQPGFPLKK